MYFPFLRGKQFEFLALRELAPYIFRMRYSNKISPIIEPVKKDFAGMAKCMKELSAYDINFNIIVNPSVGEVVNKSEVIINEIIKNAPQENNFQFAVIIDSFSSWKIVDKLINVFHINLDRITLIHEEQDADIESKRAITDNVKFNIISSKTSRRYYRNFPTHTRVTIDDYFKSLPKNSDYRHKEDEMFSDEFKFFKEEGFAGFADYLTVGKGYSEGGFLPYAVVIHLTYPKGDALRIRHFVCDSMEDQSDTAGKFREALEKLVRWVNSNTCQSPTVWEFRQLHSNEYFPGLGTIKKMSIKHHIEIVLDSF